VTARTDEEAIQTVHDYLLQTITQLRRVFARRLKAQLAKFPNRRLPCETCAFRTSTDDWQGFEHTIMSFIAAMETDSVFYCHDGLKYSPHKGWQPPMHKVNGRYVPDTSRMTPCAAWMVLQSTPPLTIAEYVPSQIRDFCVEMAKQAH
jgi:hypothetical protein